MVSVSLCMIVKNEEATLYRCLTSICDIVDEINIIDTGSTDSTKDIATQFTDRIYDFAWTDNFSDARNYSFSKATKDYVMWLDADDVILKEDKIALKELIESLDPSIDAYILKYNLTERETGHVISSFYRERLVKRSRQFQWLEPVHEYLDFSGNIKKVDIAITHKKVHLPTRRNLNIFEKYLKEGNPLSPRSHFYYARELSSQGEFEKAKKYYEIFLDTDKVVLSNYLDACAELANYYVLQDNYSLAMKTLFRYFERDIPRGDICCKIGALYKEQKDYEKAIGWFSLAPLTKVPDSLGSYSPEYWTYIPYMELCSCYYRMGDFDQAILYNEKAAQYHPTDKKVCHNRVFLSAKKYETL